VSAIAVSLRLSRLVAAAATKVARFVARDPHSGEFLHGNQVLPDSDKGACGVLRRVALASVRRTIARPCKLQSAPDTKAGVESGEDRLMANYYKRFGLLRKKPGLTHEQFVAHWTTVHADMAKRLPGLRRYVINVVDRERSP
jgi:hypothetical protein